MIQKIAFLLFAVITCVFATCSPQSLLIRTFDGSCNNIEHENWGQAGRFFEIPEGYLTPGSIPRPNERTVSNTVLAVPDVKLDINFTAQERKFGFAPDEEGKNSFFVIFGQFVAHDLGQNPLVFNFANISANYAVQIEDPTDPLYQPTINGKTGILTIPSQGVTTNGVYRTFNNATSYLDLGTVYGSSDAVANTLRTFSGGKLKADANGGLPLSADVPVPNECGTFRPGSNAAGDLRVDENLGLTAIHTIFHSEHNRLAAFYGATFPFWNDEQIFQAARTKLIATYQHIVYDEYLPVLLGPYANKIKNYKNYKNNVDVSLSATFSTAAFRIIHDMVTLPQLVLSEECQQLPIPSTDGVPLQEGSNCIPFYFKNVGIKPVLRGILDQWAQATDSRVVNGMRNVFLRATTPGGNLDVETSNIFRGREHGLVDFDTMRKFHRGRSIYEETHTGCVAGNAQDNLECFLQITSNATLAASLRSLYNKVNRVDAYVGLLAEDIEHPSHLPVTASKIILDQFEKLRDGDRLYYENEDIFPKAFIREIKRDSFAELVRRNVPGIDVNNNIFRAHDLCNLE